MAKPTHSNRRGAHTADSLEERQYLLDIEKLARDRMSREDLRINQAVTWLFASQLLLGGSYAYLKQQVDVAIQRNLVVTWQSLSSLIQYFPLAAIVLCITFLFTVVSVSVAKREIQKEYPALSLLGTSLLIRSGPVGAASIGILLSVGWCVVLFAIP